MSTPNCEKDSLLGQTVLVKRPFSNFDRGHFFYHPLFVRFLEVLQMTAHCMHKYVAESYLHSRTSFGSPLSDIHGNWTEIHRTYYRSTGNDCPSQLCSLNLLIFANMTSHANMRLAHISSPQSDHCRGPHQLMSPNINSCMSDDISSNHLTSAHIT